MAATNFCEMYDCRTTEFFRIDRFSDIFIPYHFKFIEVEDGHSSQFNMSYLADGNDWQGSATNKSITPGHGFPLDTDDDGITDTQTYLLAQIDNSGFLREEEFCHEGLGCTGFGNGTGIILQPRDEFDSNPYYTFIPIPAEISEDGDPIYTEDQTGYDPGDGGGEECFVAGTKVKMSNGLEKNIEDIQIGEQVLSYNIHTKKLESKKVTKLFTQVHDLVDGDITVKTKFNNGVETHNTIANPFWSKDKGFVAADAERCNTLHSWVKQTNKGKDTEQLKVGDTLYHYNGKELQEVMVTEIEHIVEPYIRTYDITIEDNHTFFANGILTHNSSGDGGDNDDDNINTYVYGCFDPNADNYYCDEPDAGCVNGCPPDADACLDNGSCTYGGTGTTYSDVPNLLCCLSNTHDGTVRFSGEFPFSDVESVVNLNELYYGDSELNVGNVYNADACNQVDCSIQEFDDEENLIPKVHFDGHCVNSLGTHGRFGHNIVFDHYYNIVLSNFYYDEETGEGNIQDPTLFHYPFVRTRDPLDDDTEQNAIEYIDDMENEYRYFEPINNVSVMDNDDWEDFNNGLNNGDSEFETDTIEFQNGLSSIVFDRFQTGVDKDGTELYNLPIYRNLSCQDIEDDAGIVVDDYTGKREDYDLADGFTKSPFSSGEIADIFTETYTLGDSHSKGIDFCGGVNLVDDAFEIFFDNPLYFRVIMNIFAQYTEDIWFRNIDENNELPNATNGFGLNSSGVDEIITTEFAEDYIINEFSLEENYNLNRDVLIRIGFPLPPISFNEMDCDGVRESYLKLVNEFIGEVIALTFFQDFKLTGVDIEPTMKNQLDVLSGIDLREEVLNACDYIEFMTLPGGLAMGDGIYYGGNEIPSIYFNAPYNGNVGNTVADDMTKEQYVRTFDCNTELNNNLQFSKMRAVCKDGSFVEMAQAGPNGNQNYIIHHGTTEEFFNTGMEACNSQLKLNSNQDLYYLSDNDGKESLGIFFYDSENKQNENFINDKDESFNQYNLLNGILNSNGKGIKYIYELDTWEENGWGKIYEADFWDVIRSDVHDNDYPTSDNYRSNRIAPYWRMNYSECFSLNRCIVVDTLKPIIHAADENLPTSYYDTRQGITTFIKKEDLSETAQRKNQKFKLSFMMKTIDIDDGVDLKDTGIHTVLEFDDSKVSVNNKTFADNKIKTKKYKTSQCSPSGKNENHYSNMLTKERYCTQTRASFTNTIMNRWEKMEYVFEVDRDANLKNYDGVNLYLTPLEFARTEYDLYPEIGDYDSIQNYMKNNASTILVDNVKFKEAYDFHPDVDVRKKKGPNDYGLVSLMEYYDKFKPTAKIEEFNDTTAPLELQFYFYPRFPYDDVLSPNREILLEQFEFKQFFISDIDWGDGSPIEFDTDPKKIGTDRALYHTYEQSGTYEIKGTMFTTVPELYIPSATPTNINYEGNLGVGYNQKFTIKININEGLDEDFKYFGTDGFSFIPFKNSTPVIGGTSKQSIYYKALKRNLGILDGTQINNLLVESELLTKDFHGYPSGTSAIEETLGGESGWFKINYVEGDTEFLMSNNVSVIPNTTYVESFELKHDGTLDSLNITFWNSTNGHREVSAIIEDLGIDNDGNFHKRISAEFTTAVDDTTIRAIDFKNVNGTLSFLAVKNIAFHLPTPDLDVTLVDVNYSRQSDRLKTEMAFQKIEDLYNDTGVFNLLNYYQQPANNIFDNSAEYLSTLPFPRYFQEFDITGDSGTPDNQLTPVDADRWTVEGRPDIAEEIINNLTGGGVPIGIVGIHNIMDGGVQYLGIGPFVDNETFPEDEVVFPLNNAIATYACAEVFGGNGDPNPSIGNYVVTLSTNTVQDNQGRDWLTYDCINHNLEEEGNTFPVLSESDTYNLPEVYINPTLQSQNEQYTGQQYSSITKQLGKSIGDVDLSTPKYYNKPKSIVDFFGFGETTFQYGVELNPGPNYGIFSEHWETLQGFGGNIVISAGDATWNGEEGDLNYLQLKESIEIGATYELTVHVPVNDDPDGLKVYQIGQFELNEDGDGFDTIIENAYYEIVPGYETGIYTITFGPTQNDKFLIMSAGGAEVQIIIDYISLRKVVGTYNPRIPSLPNYWKNTIPQNYSIYNREGLGGELIDTYSEQEWIDDYYYPVLPRYGQDGKFIEGDFPNNKTPFPLEGIITNNKQEDENILIGLSSDTDDINVLNDDGGNNNKGFIISDFKPKFQNDTLEIKKTKKINKLKKSTKNRAF